MHQGQNIQVFVRCRPLNPHERRSVVDVVADKNEIKVLDRSSKTQDTRNFYFDQVFDVDAGQKAVYNSVVRPLIDQVLLGFNCTVFAYGQTGTGKTYTMEGNRSEEEMHWEDDPHSGIIPRAISQLFDTLKDHDSEFTVRVSFLELYNEDTYDLLSPIDDTTKLKIFDDAQRKGSVIVGGLEEIIVQSKAEIYDILKRGSAKRQTAATLMNACSSRSHTIFSVTVHIREGSIEEDELLKIGKLNLVDLAGSENIGRSGAMDKRAREAGNINQSLLTLGRVITALVEKRPHIPYRESKLTRLLQDSLGGKTKTSIIATISPASLDLEDTMSTLDYASRAKKITNKPEMNQRLTKKALLREYAQEIERLRRDLQATREKNGIYIEEENYKEMCKQLSMGNNAIQEKEERMEALQTEIQKNKKLFEEFTSQYEKTKAELTKAMQDCERQKKLIKAQREIEKKLAHQAKELMEVAENASNDNYLLHGKKDRIENILKENRASIDKYQPEFREDIARYESLVEMCSKEVNCLNNEFYEKIKRKIESGNEAVAQVRKINIDLATKLIAQSTNLKKSIDDLKTRSEGLKNQAKHYEALAKECNNQSKSLRTEIDHRMKLADDLESQAKDLESGQPMPHRMVDVMSEFDYEAQENSKKLEQVTSTLQTSTKRELGLLRQKLDTFFTRELKEDEKTGSTPQRKVYEIPKRLSRATAYADITEDNEDLDHLNTSGFV
uniref:Kinesin-like protein n=1 Tax=Aceria tosichella TaxID=561515 RepID=A0A6G1SR69_9ACAR